MPSRRPKKAKRKRGRMSWGRRFRRGVAAVEFALCLPPLVLLILASIESSNMIFLDQSLSVAAYEAAREAIRKSGTNITAEAKADSIIQDRGIAGTQVAFVPSDVSVVAPGQPIQVKVTATCSDNTVITSWIYGGRTVESQVVMVKE